jgi:prepilin-type processing-associated H-X9-DG protein
MQCGNNLKQIGLALHNYHDTFKTFPPRKGGTTGTFAGTARNNQNGGRLSAFVPLLPFYEQAPLYQTIQGGDPGSTNLGGPIAPGGPCAWCSWPNPPTAGYTVGGWDRSPINIQCPSDTTVFNAVGNVRRNNYAFNIGDMVTNALNSNAPRGVFGNTIGCTIAEILDGTSNTLVTSEHLKVSFGISTVVAKQIKNGQGTATSIANITNTPNVCLTTSDGRYFNAGVAVKGMFGSLWTDGQAERVGFTTVLPPNAPGCTDDANGNADSVNVILPPSSNHPGGVNAGLADGSVRFIAETINCGNLGIAQPANGPSNYGVWGSMGSKAGGDTVALD